MRQGGAKGVLSLDPTLPGRQVVLRDSQVKFAGGYHQEIELCSLASRIPYYLNRSGPEGLADLLELAGKGHTRVISRAISTVFIVASV